ncbi:putative ATPase [Pseudoduganella lurida]|uniref:Putative ATPase n=1 Tax=Pseudoduganella lurida TaxID=1036180 RepID=A0A562R089_9BURK|nr:winged helix-turn-helix domain-containing protein [Pseudoduganella lurida]TWI62489.1 putative ATPase [Pseudoduganella lurida]
MDRKHWGTAEEVAFGAFRLVPHARALYRHGARVHLSGRAIDVLTVLVERAGTVVTKEELMALVWPRTCVEEGNLRVHVAALRKALGSERAYVENIVGRGYVFVAPVSTATAATLPSPPAGRTAPGPRLLGRDAFLDQLARDLPHQRLITIAGPGGMGKTSVALALCSRTGTLFGSAVHVADLAPLADPALLPGAVAQVLGLAAVTPDGLVAAMAAALAGGQVGTAPAPRVLLVLDSCEHLVAAVAALAARLLRELPGVHIVATSREPLHVDGEQVHWLPPLAVPDAWHEATGLDQLAAYPAVQLFVERASAAGGTFLPDAANATAIAGICRRLDGIPLALELAAGRAAFFGVQELARRLSDCFGVLTHGWRTALPRHQTLRATLDWSHDLLSPGQQATLRRLAVFRGAFTSAAAAQVAQGGGMGATAAAEHVRQLAAKSLVALEADAGAAREPRYRLFDTTRSYALDRLRAAGEEAAVMRLYVRLWCDLPEVAQPPAGDGATEAWQYGPVDDVRAALDWSFGPAGEPLAGARLAAVSAPLWYRLSLMDEYRMRLAPALAFARAAGAAGAPLAMLLHLALGHTLLHVGGAASAARAAAFGQALALAQRLGDDDAARRALWGCYADALFQGEYRHALALACRFGTLARAAGTAAASLTHRRLVARALHYLGDQRAAGEEVAAVVAHPARAASADGFQFDGRVSSLAIHGRLLWLQGLPEQALAVARDGVDEAQRLGHAVSLCFALVLAVPVALWCGDLALARRCTALMEESARRDSLAHWQFWSRAFRAALQRHAGEPAEPADLLVRHPLCGGLLLDVLPTLHPGLLTPRALVRAEEGRAGWAGAELLRCWGEELVRVGALAQAERTFRRALALAQGQGALAWELRAATSLARLLGARGAGRHGADVLGRAYARCTEGWQTRDVAAAAALLDRLASGSPAPLRADCRLSA